MMPNILEPADREAIAQLRVLLRGGHGLTAEQEEQLIARQLGSRSLVPVAHNAVTGTATLEDPDWMVASLRAPAIEAGMVGVAATASLAVAWGSGDALFHGVYGAHPLVAVLTGTVGILLLAWLPLRAWYDRRGSGGVEGMKTAASCIVGAGLVEYAVTQWPSGSGPTTLHNFVIGNLLVLVLSCTFAMVCVRHGMLARRPIGGHATHRLALGQGYVSPG